VLIRWRNSKAQFQSSQIGALNNNKASAIGFCSACNYFIVRRRRVMLKLNLCSLIYGLYRGDGVLWIGTLASIKCYVLSEMFIIVLYVEPARVERMRVKGGFANGGEHYFINIMRPPIRALFFVGSRLCREFNKKQKINFFCWDGMNRGGQMRKESTYKDMEHIILIIKNIQRW
jgi:hypothetical protein